MRILAIDPGNKESGWSLVDSGDLRPIAFGKDLNLEVRRQIVAWDHDFLAIEMVASYGMAVGKDVFETCVWIGRFLQYQEDHAQISHLDGREHQGFTYRRDIKLHHCGSSRAKDSNVRQALVDRFTPGQPNHGKGTKAEPGWFYGFRADIWQAYALAVYAADLEEVGGDE